MNPAVKYTLARLGIFVVIMLVLWPVQLDILLKVLIAVLFSAAVSWFLLRRMRDDVAAQVEDAMRRRRSDREKLRAALAGEDEHTPERTTEPTARQEEKEGRS